MELIDCHVHCLDPDLLPREFWRLRAEGIAARRGRPVDLDEMAGKIRDNTRDSDGDLLAKDLRDAGFTHALLVGLDWGLLGEPTPTTHPRHQLDWAKSVIQRHDDLFSRAAPA